MKNIRNLIAVFALALPLVAQERTSALKDGSNVDPATWRGVLDVPATDAIPATPGDIGAATAAQGALADTALQNSIATNKLLGRGTAGTGTIEQITLGTNLSLSGTTLNATGGGTVDNAGVNAAIATNTQATARAAKVIGYNQQIDTNPRELWRPYVKMLRRNNNLAPNGRAPKTLGLGDSVGVDISELMNKACGYGGSFLAATGGSGIENIEDWTVAPTGWKRRLNTVNEYVEFAPTGICQAVGLIYSAQTSGGSVQIQYQANKTGGWVALTSGTWAVATKVDNCTTVLNHPVIAPRDYHQVFVGDTVTGTGIPGGTTVSAVGISSVAKTATTNGTTVVTLDSVTGLALGMRATNGGLLNSYISAINVAANQVTMSANASTSTTASITFNGPAVTLSANASASATNNLTFAHADGGSDSGSGVLSTNNSGAATYSVAWIVLPGNPNYYNIRAVHTGTGGNVDILGAYFDNGGFGFGTVNTVAPQAHVGAGMSAGGTSLAAHHSLTTQTTWKRALAMLDPEVITYKTANALTLANLQTYWPAYAANLRTAAPNALLVVIGSHPSDLYPTRDAADMVACDNYWREWCAETDGAIFIDMRANMPAQNYDFWTTDGLWQDGIHPYRGGMDWANLLTWNAIKPAIEGAQLFNSQLSGRNGIRPFMGDANQVRLIGGITQANTGSDNNTFSILTEHIDDGYFGLFGNNKGRIGGDIKPVLTGLGIRSSAGANSTADELFLLSKGNRIFQWAGSNGFVLGAASAASTKTTQAGSRIFGVPNYGASSGFTYETEYSNGGNPSYPAMQWHRSSSDTSNNGEQAWQWMMDGSIRTRPVLRKDACSYASSVTLTVPDTTGLATGMRIFGRLVPAGTTITALPTGTTVTMSASAGNTASNETVFFTRAADIKFTYPPLTTTADVSIHTPLGVPGSHSGTAQAGTALSITLATTASAIRDHYVGATLTITGGTGSGQTTTITAYNEVTKVATVPNTAWTVPDATSTYTVTGGRVYAVIPSYTDSTVAEAAVGQWEAYYDQSTGKVKVDPNP